MIGERELDVSELGDVLELLHDSKRRWHTIRVRGTDWRDRPVLTEAFRRETPVAHGPIAGTGMMQSASVSVRVEATAVRVDGKVDPDETTESWAYWQDAGNSTFSLLSRSSRPALGHA
jgi:hypothetical protein